MAVMRSGSRHGWAGDLARSLGLGLLAGTFAFFVANFTAIATLGILSMAGGKHMDFTVAYKYIGAPAGLAVAVIAFLYFLIRLRRGLGAF